ncbi:antibiotic biosynthesis monooxygenase family protein [Pseudovibrio exalbescens]|uniref:Antibiotic biosynthesis monooxygenase n=1 Tax=Pseudovibrio exalbescens TaxID=197461 RepID=A0A1U7JM63_9HYPH|nr:antibiotic biosynthesis monooxygenase [Pseudovibrio exalbescens]OKL45794.1 antibiotic biosynthesis monooxygenase [Pseudovibrio exalbescens]
MIAVIFEVEPDVGQQTAYLEIAKLLREELERVDGFLSVERFQSLADENKILSLSFFRDETAVKEWRNKTAHRISQARGRNGIFKTYRIRVAHVLRDYSMTNRAQAPDDSLHYHDHM